MFKAKIIEDLKYYKYIQWSLILMLLFSILGGIFGGSITNSSFSIVNILLGFTFYIVFIFITYYIQKHITSQIDKKTIEISEKTISIKSPNSEINIDLAKTDTLIVKMEYLMPGDTQKSFWNQIRGKQYRNFIIVEQDQKSNTYEFTLDSYYMIEELKKMIASWKASSFNVIEVE